MWFESCFVPTSMLLEGLCNVEEDPPAWLADLFFARGGHTLESYVTNPTRADRIKCMKELQCYSLPFGALTICARSPFYCSLILRLNSALLAACFQPWAWMHSNHSLYFSLKRAFWKTKTNLEQKKENLHLQGDIVVTCFRSLKLPWHQRIFIWLREIHTDQHPYSHHKPFLYQLLWIGQEVKCTKKHKECTSQFQSHKPLLQLLSREEDMLSFIPSF